MYALRESTYGRVWMFCPVTGKPGKTGMEGTPELFAEVERECSRSRLLCPVCGRKHSWQSMSPRLVPNEPVIGHA